MKPSQAMAWIAAAVGMWILLGAMNVFWGDLNQDEGWYLYAARQVHEGYRPFRDFAFTQGPMLPLVYGGLYPWVQEHGLIAGRWITMGWGGIALAATAGLAARMSRPDRAGPAAVVAALLLGVNVYQSQFTTTVKTYGLCTAFLMIGMLLAQRAGEFRRPWSGLAGGVFLALAAATRLSAGAALPVIWLYLLGTRTRRRTGAWWFVGWGAVAGLAVVFSPFVLTAPEGLRFGLFEYHWAPRGGGAALVYKAGFVSRMVGAYYVAAGAAAVWGVVRLSRGFGRKDGDPDHRPAGVAMTWITGLAITLVHVSAPFPYDDYQVIAYPLFCAALGAILAHGLPAGPRGLSARRANGLAACLFLLTTAAAFSSPVNLAWATRGRDRIWWEIKQESPIGRLQRVARDIAALAPPDRPLLTQDTYLAVECNRSVPAGMELGPFCLFPEMSTERAKRLRVLNLERMGEVIQSTDAVMAAFSGYGLAIASPGVRRLDPATAEALEHLLTARYRFREEVPYFGQGFTTLRIFERRTGDPAPDRRREVRGRRSCPDA